METVNKRSQQSEQMPSAVYQKPRARFRLRSGAEREGETLGKRTRRLI